MTTPATRNGIRLLQPLRADDQRAVVQVIEASVVIRTLDRAFDRMAKTIESSAATDVFRGLLQRLGSRQKRLMAGIILMSAASVHVGLLWSYQRPAGWFWLIAPGLAAAIGLLTSLSALRENDPSD